MFTVSLGLEWLLSGVCCLDSKFLCLRKNTFMFQEHVRPSLPGSLCLCGLRCVLAEECAWDRAVSASPLCSQALWSLMGEKGGSAWDPERRGVVGCEPATSSLSLGNP